MPEAFSRGLSRVSGRIPAWVDGDLIAVDKLDVHRRGLLHKAVSVFVMAGSRTLIQRRAATKYHTPGLWANTCCTHPHWGETASDCARRRLVEELGIGRLALAHCDQIEYRADVGNGMTEHEIVDIFMAETDGCLSLSPNPAEVAECRWVELPDLVEDLRARPEIYTPWLKIYLGEHRHRIFGDNTALHAAQN